MRRVTASIEVPQSREQVYDYLDVLGNHEPFTDHFLIGWRLDRLAERLAARDSTRPT